MDENINSNTNLLINSNNRISNLSELIKHIKEYKDLCEKSKTSSKVERIMLEEQIAHKEHILRHGIKYDNNVLLQHIEYVKEFVESLGFDYTLIELRLNSLELGISPVNLLTKGKLCNYGTFIVIDYSYAEFDENGNIVGLNEPKVNFFKHTIIHELLHSVSNTAGVDKDSFSEGITEYFAHKISKATNIFTDWYEYIERIFFMFGTMMGDELLFEDYVTGIAMKNLRAFLSSLGISENEYRTFKINLDDFLKKKSNNQQNSEELMELKNEIDKFIFNRIIMPYCAFDKILATKMQERFFSKSEQTKLELCEIHSNSDEKKVKG